MPAITTAVVPCPGLQVPNAASHAEASPGLLSVGLFLAHLCAGAARRSEGFLLEPLH